MLKGDVLVAKLRGFATATTFDMSDDEICPGSIAYMPPEVFPPVPLKCCEKIDCFSFGVLTIEILTRKFPEPSDRTDSLTSLIVPEIQRRQNHIQLIKPKHPLRQVATDCLRNYDGERPSAHELCEKLAGLKESSQYTESARTRPASEREILQSLQSERQQHALEQERNREEIHRLQTGIKQKEAMIEDSRLAMEQEVKKIVHFNCSNNLLKARMKSSAFNKK